LICPEGKKGGKPADKMWKREHAESRMGGGELLSRVFEDSLLRKVQGGGPSGGGSS